MRCKMSIYCVSLFVSIECILNYVSINDKNDYDIF